MLNLGGEVVTKLSGRASKTMREAIGYSMGL
jgi:hypothetical protein